MKTEIKEGDSNTIVNGKGYIHVLLINESHTSVGASGRKAMFKSKLRDTTDKNLERDICPICLKKCLKVK